MGCDCCKKVNPSDCEKCQNDKIEKTNIHK